jgi:hypothetical protein
MKMKQGSKVAESQNLFAAVGGLFSQEINYAS